MKTLFISLILCLPAFSQDGVLVKTEVIGECRCQNPDDKGDSAIYTFECDIRREDGSLHTWKLDIPIASYPESWAKPEAKKVYAVGRGTDGKIYAIATPKPAPPSVVVTVPPSPCHGNNAPRGERCTGEMRRLHPANGLDAEKAKRP